MRKSPFSTPRGSNHGGTSNNCQSNDRNNDKGYQTNHNYSINSSIIGLNNSINDGDFIPFDNTNQSPNTQQRTNYYRGRGRSNQFYNTPNYHNRNNNNFSPRGHYTPHNQRGWNKNSNNKSNFSIEKNRDIPITKFLNITSCLEDPWKDLINKNNIDNNKKIIIDTKNNLNDNEINTNNIDKLESNL